MAATKIIFLSWLSFSQGPGPGFVDIKNVETDLQTLGIQDPTLPPTPHRSGWSLVSIHRCLPSICHNRVSVPQSIAMTMAQRAGCSLPPAPYCDCWAAVLYSFCTANCVSLCHSLPIYTPGACLLVAITLLFSGIFR